MLKIQDVGVHLVAGFQGTEFSPELSTLIREFAPGGLILFRRNFESPAQLEELVRKIREASGSRRVFVGVDQEGGRVARFREHFTEWPPMADLGLTNDPELAERFGYALGSELAAVGIDWNFAPVMDTNSNPDNPIIGDRSFGDTPDRVERIGTAVIRGMQKAGVMACAKHFPGHGHTGDDSHLTLPVVLEAENTLLEREIPPFLAAIEAGVASIMTAHVVYPVLDLNHPATTSQVIIGGMLRRAYNYTGLVVTDDMEMKAITDRYEFHDAAGMAFLSGIDMIMACENPEAQEAIVRTLYDGRRTNLFSAETFLAAQRRIEQAATKFPVPSGDPAKIGCGDHRSLSDEIRYRAKDVRENLGYEIRK